MSKASSRHSVRLACVRHAASVHPEPGSNSLKFVLEHFRVVILEFNLYPELSTDTFVNLLYILVCTYCNCLSISLLKVITGSFFSLFNFQGPLFSLYKRSSTLLWGFHICVGVSLDRTCAIIIPFTTKVKGFFEIFLNFFQFIFRLCFLCDFFRFFTIYSGSL